MVNPIGVGLGSSAGGIQSSIPAVTGKGVYPPGPARGIVMHPGRFGQNPPNIPPPALDSGAIPGDLHGPTPRIIRETGAPSQIVGRITLANGVWTPIDVDRATILFVRDPIEGDDGEGVALWYNFGEVPIPTGGILSQSSERGGVAFLSGPGRWWVEALTALGGSVTIDVIDAFSPGVQSKYLGQPGCNFVRQTNTSITSATAVTTIAQANRDRLAITIQNVTTIGGTQTQCRICIGQDPTYLSTGAWTGKGTRLVNNGSVTYAGDTLSRGTVYGILESGVVATGIEVIEYFGLTYIP